MASTVERSSSQDIGTSESEPSIHSPRGDQVSGGSSIGKLVVGLFILLVLIGAGAYTYRSLSGGSTDTMKAAITRDVEPGTLLITVSESGNVESSSNIEVKCQVAGGATILWIIEDGTEVEKGQEIVRLDDSAIRDQLNAQKIVYEKAVATKIQAAEEYGAAVIAVKEYIEGTYVKELQTVEADITIAMENLRSAENILEHTKKMFRKGFTTKLQVEADEFAVKRSHLELDAANTAKKVLTEFTREKMIKDLESSKDSTAAKLRAEEAALSLEESRLKQLETQLTNCIINAPQKGMVVYANQSSSWRSSSPSVSIEEGAGVRERQTIVQLPDLSQMQVKVTVHETKVNQIKPGLPARITIMDRVLNGRVKSVASQPESSSLMSSNIKVYATLVEIQDDTAGLRPGMTAETEILLAELKDALAVPVQSVVEQRGTFYCWVQTPTGPERRTVILGSSNDKLIEIKDGLLAGDRILLNPRAIVAEARNDTSVAASGRLDDRFGGRSSELAEAASAAPPAGAPVAGPPGSAEAGPPSGAGGGRRGSMNVMQLDTDGDGKVSKSEAPEQMQGMFDRVDTNGDGTIDSTEMNAMMQRVRSGGGGPGGGAPGGPGAP